MELAGFLQVILRESSVSCRICLVNLFLADRRSIESVILNVMRSKVSGNAAAGQSPRKYRIVYLHRFGA
jgi:hypothetical protein